MGQRTGIYGTPLVPLSLHGAHRAPSLRDMGVLSLCLLHSPSILLVAFEGTSYLLSLCVVFHLCLNPPLDYKLQQADTVHFTALHFPYSQVFNKQFRINKYQEKKRKGKKRNVAASKSLPQLIKKAIAFFPLS